MIKQSIYKNIDKTVVLSKIDDRLCKTCLKYIQRLTRKYDFFLKPRCVPL